MGILQPSFKKALIDELFYNVENSNSIYYAFAANPIPYPLEAPTLTTDDYSSQFIFDWQLMFGKRLTKANFAVLIENNEWVSNTVYDRYDNTDVNLFERNNFYVICTPEYTGGYYNIYKCMDNANGAASTIKPDLIQYNTFQTSDGYKWRYLTSVSYRVHSMFATSEYVPVYANNVTSVYANNYSGVEKVVITNPGSGYIGYHNGTIRSVNTSLLQIDYSAAIQSGLYNNSSIYVYNSLSTTAQLFKISDYVANSVGNWVYIEGEANTDNIQPEATQYIISPRVVFDTDGLTPPIAYSIVDPNTNTISDIVILDTGSDITWANVHIDSLQGSGANMYAIVPPPGGHGGDVISELNVKGLGISFSFSNNESATIPDYVRYNKIGILKNPHSLNYNSNNSKGSVFTANSFNQLFKGILSSPVTFSNGDFITGNTSGALGAIAFANSDNTQILFSGDKYFANGEYIISSDGSTSSEIEIVERPDLYSKDIKPIYVQNINNVNRSNSQTESFKLIIQL